MAEMEHQWYGTAYILGALFHSLRLNIIPLSLLSVLAAVPLSLYADGGPPGGTQSGAAAAPAAAEYLIIDVYDTLRQAQARAALVRRQGGEVRVRSDEITLTMDNLRLGNYSNPADAEEAIQRLHEHGINGQLIGNADSGFGVSIGVFSSSKNVRRLQNQLISLGFENVEIEPLKVVKTRYIVEKRLEVEPPAPGSNGAAAPARSVPAETAPAAGNGMAPSATQAPSSSGQGSPGMFSGGASLDSVRLETDWLTRGDQPVHASHYMHAGAGAHMYIRHEWEFRISGRVDGYYQTGMPDVQTTHLDYGESYIRYHGASSRITAGAQTVIWGRTDEIPPNDRMSVQDLSRFVLDDLPQRRRAVAALRIEQFAGPFKADLLWVPRFRPAELPSFDNIWSPVDRSRGRIISIDSTPVLTQLVQQGRFTRDAGGEGGAGLRLSGTADVWDYALTVQRTPHNTPYYRLDPAVRDQLLSGADVATAVAAASSTFSEIHPWSWFVGSDLGLDALSATWRLEATYISAVPVTTSDYVYTTERGVDWVAGVEFYPGDTNARVNLQFSGAEILDTPSLLDRTDIYTVNGSVESPFMQSRWRASLRFSFGLGKEDIYLDPKLAYIGWEPNEIYIAGHYFSGAEDTMGGFHQDHDMITLGWQAKY